MNFLSSVGHTLNYSFSFEEVLASKTVFLLHDFPLSRSCVVEVEEFVCVHNRTNRMVKNEHISPIFTNTLTSTELIIKFKNFGLIIMLKGLNQFHFLFKISLWYGLLMCDLFYRLPYSEYSSYSWIEISVCFKCHLKVYLFATINKVRLGI